MKNLVDYLKSMNPKENQKAILIFGSKYKLYREDEYIGVGTWTEDENVGDSFQRPSSYTKGAIEVMIADKWELILKPKK